MPTVSTSIRLPQELYEWLKDKAENEHRTISNMLIAVLIDAKNCGKYDVPTEPVIPFVEDGLLWCCPKCKSYINPQMNKCYCCKSPIDWEKVGR